MKKFPPIPIRDRGGSATIDNPDDGTPIREQFVLADGLLMLTDKCVYRIQLADQIDPQRQNPHLPPMIQQKLFDHGVQSELLQRTLLQAKVLFRKEFQSIDNDLALQHSFDALVNLISMDEVAKAFATAQQAAIDKARRLGQKGMSVTLPAVGDVRSQCKSFAQKAHHFCSALLSIVRLFYPVTKKLNWDGLYKLAQASYGTDDSFCKVLEIAVPVLKLVLNARDCLDHHNLSGVETSDFSLSPDGTVTEPSIAINFRGSIQDSCPIVSFMSEMTSSLSEIFEMFIVHLCSKHCQPFAGFSMHVDFLSENDRRARYVRFAYGMNYQGQGFVPCG